MKKIITLTLSPSLDISSSVKHLEPEHKLRCAEPQYEAGGGGINVSRVLKRIGGDSTAIYTKGGASGILFEELLTKESIHQKVIACTNRTRENFVIVETSTNQQYRFVMPGPPLLDKEWKACLAEIQNTSETIDYIIASGSTPQGVPFEFYEMLAQIAKDRNAKLVLDTSGDNLKAALNKGIFLLKPNTKELGEMVGRELKTIKEQKDAAKQVIETGKIEILVVSMGSSGALIASKEGMHHVMAPNVMKKSTVGAGDSMVAGLVWAISSGFSLVQVLCYGIACGTAATMNNGSELCHKKDVDMLYYELLKNNT